ncbi:MAG: TIGR02186 family protein [Thermodesulfovibrionia bacterium]|nr:TIGR02186 family protein [Thermodesulfovibrionia bacterium]
MSQKTGYRIRTLIVLALISMLYTVSPLLFADKASAELTLDINHSHIKIDFLYHGSEVSVKGTADRGTDLIIKITSPNGHESLRKKGKIAGILWMNVGQINFENVPGFYSIHSTKDIKKMLDPAEMDKYGIGYSALEKNSEITGISESDRKKWFAEFLKYKKGAKLYSTSVGMIEISEKEGILSYYTKVSWPYQAKPGEYKVTVYAVKDGKVIEQSEKTVLVEQVGIVKTLADMAKQSGALYGIISIVIALGAGFGVGIIFRKGGGSH